MSFITKNVGHLLCKKTIGKRRYFGHPGQPRRIFAPEYLLAVITKSNLEEYKEIANSIMNLYKAKQIDRSEAQARLWPLATGIIQDYAEAKARREFLATKLKTSENK